MGDFGGDRRRRERDEEIDIERKKIKTEEL